MRIMEEHHGVQPVPAVARGAPEHNAVHWIDLALTALALVALAVAVLTSVTRAEIPWDSWAYHLPFSAYLWNIGGRAQSFLLDPELEPRFHGFPLAAEFLQGALWKASGTIVSTTLINSLALAGFVLVAAKGKRTHLPVLAFGALSVPLIALHARSSYIDLFVACALCFQVLAAVRLEAAYRTNSTRTIMPGAASWIALYVISAAAAGNAKVPATVLSLAISAFLLAYCVVFRRRFSPERLKIAVVLLLVTEMLSSTTAIRNTYLYSNPFYPTAVDVPAIGVHFKGPEPEYVAAPRYPIALGPFTRPVNWLLSVTEIDWQIRGVRRAYTVDAGTGDAPERYGKARTGGYWGALMMGSLVLAAALALSAARRNPAAIRANALILILFAYLSAVTAFMPLSHELRYYLYWPILLLFTICALMEAAAVSLGTKVAIAAAYLGAFVFSEYMTDFPLRSFPAYTQAELVGVPGDSPEVARAREIGGVCLGPEYKPRQFAYASIFMGGDYTIEQGWSTCSRLPRYIRHLPHAVP